MMRSLILCIVLLFGYNSGAGAAWQEDPYSFYPDDVTYNPEIPTPENYIGHKLGQGPVRHNHMVDYLLTVANLSDRMEAEILGYSHEGRPILLLVISSPENMARIDAIRAAHVALSNPEANQPISADMPVVTWLNYGVHGAEASGMDAAIPTVYYLAAAEGPGIEQMLEGSVILIQAVYNPDGHARRAAWEDQNASEVVIRDPNDRLHNQDWPGARTNHYWFDLNRQWLLQTQPESNALINAWHDWKPNIMVDYHEMGTDQTYYFHPGIPEQTYPLMPQATLDLLNAWAEGPAAALDVEGRFYYNEETFNYFYIGTGSAYPMVNGSVGMLFEASSARGGEIEGNNGLRTYRDNIWKHFRTSIASVESAWRLRDQFLTHQKDYFIEALQLGARDPVAGYVVTESGDDVRLWEFLKLLSRHRITFHQLTQTLTIGGKVYPAGRSYVIPSAQPQYRLVKSLFEAETEFATTVFYDVSAWNMPMLYNLGYSELRSIRITDLGASAMPAYPAVAAPDRSRYAYVFDWRPYYAPRALNRLHEAGVFTRVATKPMTVVTTRGEVPVARGAIIVPLYGQDLAAEDIYALMATIAAEDSVRVLAATSGKTSTTGADLGGESVKPLKPVKALLVTGAGVSSYDAGEIWHLLDFRMNIPLTRVNLQFLPGIDLSEYTHLIVPEGYDIETFDEGYSIDEDLTAKIKTWIKAGGVLVATRSGAAWAEAALLNEPEEDDAKEDTEDEDQDEPRSDYANRRNEGAEHIVGGAIFGSDLDITHPLAFGYSRRTLASPKANEFTLETPEGRYSAVAVYLENPRLAGYASDKMIAEIAGTPMLVAERMGKGAIILFADDPNFRATTWGTNKLFLNALFFGDVF